MTSVRSSFLICRRETTHPLKSRDDRCLIMIILRKRREPVSAARGPPLLLWELLPLPSNSISKFKISWGQSTICRPEERNPVEYPQTTYFSPTESFKINPISYTMLHISRKLELIQITSLDRLQLEPLTLPRISPHSLACENVFTLVPLSCSWPTVLARVYLYPTIFREPPSLPAVSRGKRASTHFYHPVGLQREHH